MDEAAGRMLRELGGKRLQSYNIVPCHHKCVLEIPDLNERLFPYGDSEEERSDNVGMLARRGRLMAYIGGPGCYVLYDQARRKALVSACDWPAPPAWVDAGDPIDAIANYIDFSTGNNDLEYRAEDITVVCRGHRAAANAIFLKLANARYGGDAVVLKPQYLGYEGGDRGMDFMYRGFMGSPHGNNELAGHYDFLHVRLMPPKKAFTEAA